MSQYYKYKFISPEPLYAKIKEELRSYFDTGVVDDILFPVWTKHCLDKLGKGSYVITETYLEVDGYEARLPSDFISVREAWMCTTTYDSYRLPSAVYTQTTMKLTPDADVCSTDECDRCDPCPDIIHITYKTTNEILRSFRTTYLLRPGNVSRNKDCSLPCNNHGAESVDSFEVVANKFVTNFQCGSVYLIYYSDQYDDCNNQLIPDNLRIKDYIEAYIKYKIFEQIYNSVSDETFNQVERKYMLYKQLSDEAYILAQIETKKETIDQKIKAIQRGYNRFNKYNID